MLTWVGLPREEGAQGVSSAPEVTVGMHFLPPSFTSDHSSKTGHLVAGSQSSPRPVFRGAQTPTPRGLCPEASQLERADRGWTLPRSPRDPLGPCRLAQDR